MKVQYPADHKAAMRVPNGGSSCVSCEYLGADGKTCRNKFFIAYNGSNKLPYPATEFCSDWYEPAPGALQKQSDVKSDKIKSVEKYLEGLRKKE